MVQTSDCSAYMLAEQAALRPAGACRTLITHLLFLQATFMGKPGCSLSRVACRMSSFVPTALTVLSGLASPKGCRKIDATLDAHLLGSPGMLTAAEVHNPRLFQPAPAPVQCHSICIHISLCNRSGSTPATCPASSAQATAGFYPGSRMMSCKQFCHATGCRLPSQTAQLRWYCRRSGMSSAVAAHDCLHAYLGC